MIHPNGTEADRITAAPYSNPRPSCRNRTPQIMSRIVVGMNSRPAIMPHIMDWGFRKTTANARPAVLSQSPP